MQIIFASVTPVACCFYSPLASIVKYFLVILTLSVKIYSSVIAAVGINAFDVFCCLQTCHQEAKTGGSLAG